ncbi:MAG TPA: hypothetical protein VFM98_19260 [Ramlibacter sp.]|uniref:hypothetical protein n=1 Tax=Ramlibacter sp. TaxID=1917967 RepID=UPI002D80C270|nr:hypothetical protein [Ramlibacter sp.]HET8747747.1 hypothetical protein [Ramlibacter sp.]
MKRLFSHSVTRGVSLAAIAFAAAFAGEAALAATAANTPINNRAQLNYKVGTVDQDPIGSSKTGNTSGSGEDTTFLVDNKVNPIVTTQNTAAVTAVPGKAAVATEFKVANGGNAPQDMLLTIGNVSNGDVFGEADNENFADLSKCKVSIDGATAQALPAYTGTITAGSDVAVQVLCDIPKDLADQKVVGIYLTAEAREPVTRAALVESTGADTATVDVVFADENALDDATGGVGNDGKRDAKHSKRSGYKIETAVLTVKKTVKPLCDGFNTTANAKNIPGAYVQYVVEIKNDGVGTAQLTTMADNLDANVTFAQNAVDTATCKELTGDIGFTVDSTRLGSQTYTSTGSVDGADWSDVPGTGGKINIDFTKLLPAASPTYPTAGELKTGQSITVIYNVKIN